MEREVKRVLINRSFGNLDQCPKRLVADHDDWATRFKGVFAGDPVIVAVQRGRKAWVAIERRLGIFLGFEKAATDRIDDNGSACLGFFTGDAIAIGI